MEGELIRVLQESLSMPEEKALELMAAGSIMTVKKTKNWFHRKIADHLALIIQDAMRSYLIS